MIAVVAAGLIAVGIFFMAVSAIGLIRLPDFYTRAHAVAKSETLGLLLIVLGLVLLHGGRPGTLQLLLIAGFAFLANATAMHALARAAVRVGVTPWTKEDR